MSTEKALQQLKLLLLRFLYGDKNDKIKQNTMINDYEKKKIDVLNFSKALKIARIKRIP